MGEWNYLFMILNIVILFHIILLQIKEFFLNYNQFSSWASPMQPRHLRAILHPASLLKSPYKPKGKIKAKKLHFAQKEPLI